MIIDIETILSNQRGYSKDIIFGTFDEFMIIDETDWLSENISFIEPKVKDWESRIPDSNPFNRSISNPSEKTRAKLRSKRKNKK
jgi:hypothetical protein